MKAQPLKKIEKGYTNCSVNVATHIHINFPSPSGNIIIPVKLDSASHNSINWSWNGDTEKPTITPSILTTNNNFRCHSFVNNGKAKFLSDCSHDLVNQTVDMLEVE
jgi:hypothetical protein